MHLTGTCFQDAVTFFENLPLCTSAFGRRLRALPSSAWKVVHATLASGYGLAWVEVRVDLQHLCIHAVVLRDALSPRKIYVAQRCSTFGAGRGGLMARIDYSLGELVEHVTMTSSVGPWEGAVRDSWNPRAAIPEVRLSPLVVVFEDVLLDAESRVARHQAFERLR